MNSELEIFLFIVLTIFIIWCFWTCSFLLNNWASPIDHEWQQMENNDSTARPQEFRNTKEREQ